VLYRSYFLASLKDSMRGIHACHMRRRIRLFPCITEGLHDARHALHPLFAQLDRLLHSLLQWSAVEEGREVEGEQEIMVSPSGKGRERQARHTWRRSWRRRRLITQSIRYRPGKALESSSFWPPSQHNTYRNTYRNTHRNTHRYRPGQIVRAPPSGQPS